MSGSRKKQLRREFREIYGRSPRDAKVVDGTRLGNEFRAFKKHGKLPWERQ